jgi:multidrug efflux pump subunit AcrA (membrane-fusion protein)
LAGAEAKVKSKQAAVNAMYIIAPFDGEVLAVQAVAGNSATKGGNAVVVVDKSTLQIDMQVDESKIGTVMIGQPAVITMDALPGVTLTGKVSMINPIGSTVNGVVNYTVTVKIDPTDEPVLFGGTASIVVTTGEPHTELLVPLNAIWNDSTNEYLMVRDSAQQFQRLNVKTGSIFEKLVVVYPDGDLKAGDVLQINSSSSTSSSSSSSSNRGGFGGGFSGPPPGG